MKDKRIWLLVAGGLIAVLLLLFTANLFRSRPTQSKEDREAVQAMLRTLDEVIADLEGGSRKDVRMQLALVKNTMEGVSILTPQDRTAISDRFARIQELNQKVFEETKDFIEKNYTQEK